MGFPLFDFFRVPAREDIDMSLFEQIDKDYVQAYKAKDAVRLSVLRLLKTAVKNRLVELRRPGGTLTDEEMLELYGTRPDAFNEEEFLRVSSLKSDPEEKMEVYRTTLKYFPQSQVAANNLAIMLLGTDGLTEADEILSVLQTYLPETQNTHAVVKAERTSTELAKELLAACDTLPEARYNLGLLKAAVKDFAGAYELLRPFGDLNAAVTAVCLGKFVEADAILDALQDMSPETEYVRAMVAAALMDADAFFTHLEPAVADEALRQRAENDSYFDVYRHDDRFKVIMEGR